MKTLYEVYGFRGLAAMFVGFVLLAAFCAYKWDRFALRRKWRRNLLAPRRDAELHNKIVRLNKLGEFKGGGL